MWGEVGLGGQKRYFASHPSILSDSMDVTGTRDNHGFPVIETACHAGDLGSILGSGRSVGGGHGYHSNILPGESQTQRSLVGYSPQDHNESDTT